MFGYKTTDWSFRPPPGSTGVDGPLLNTTADPNSLVELMRGALMLPGDDFPYDPDYLLRKLGALEKDVPLEVDSSE